MKRCSDLFALSQQRSQRRAFLAAIFTLSLMAGVMFSVPAPAQVIIKTRQQPIVTPAQPITSEQPIANRQLPTELRGAWLTNIDSDVLFKRENLTSAL